MARLLFIVNVDWFFLSHRLPIAVAAVRQGYEVHIATGITDRRAELEAQGLVVHPLPLERSGMHPARELRSLWAMGAVLRSVRPDVVHLVTIKPAVFGGVLARLMRVPGVIVAVPGLGFAFRARGPRAVAVRALLGLLYRFALGRRRLLALFQNPDDRDRLIGFGGLRREQCVLVRGSGVDLGLFRPRPAPDGPVVAVLAARMLRDKGVEEFVAAAALLAARRVPVRLCLVGAPDPGNRASLTEEQLEHWRQHGPVEVWGHHDRMADVFGRCHMVVLPSYGEGLPKVLLEAAACGRAVVTTDVPGCRDAIEQGVTGLLVAVGDAHALAAGIERLVLDEPLRSAMGRAGRALAEREFGIERVVALHLDSYRRVLEAA